MKVRLFTKPECSLCNDVQKWLHDLQTVVPHQLILIDIEQDAVLNHKYGERIPVLKAGPYTLEAPFDEVDLRITLLSARNGDDAQQAKQNPAPKSAVFANRMVLFLARHWLAFFNLFVFLYVGIPFAAPVFMNAGMEWPARAIHKIYSPLCHQLGYRSWYLFGEQAAYPLSAAHTDLISFEYINGNAAVNMNAARAFIGNEVVGYKVVLCQRCTAIYGGMLLTGMAFSLVRKRLKAIPMWAWFIFGILPIALDGGTQLLGVIPVISFPVRESTPLMRTISGGLFGVMNILMSYPYVEEAMNDTRILVLSKLAGVRDAG